LTGGTTYYYRVAAVNTEGDVGTLSTEEPGTTTANPLPSQVTGLTVTPASTTQLNLAWTANAATENIDHYNVYRGTTAGFTVVPGTTVPLAQPTTNSYANTGLTASTTYYYRVAAVNATGQIGTLSPEVSGRTLPSQVTGLTVTPTSATQLNLAWTAIPAAQNIDHYNVYRGTTSGFTVVPGTTVPIAQPTTNSYNNTGLTASTTYYYRVAAVNAAGGIGTPSTQVSRTTLPA
jgi:fibronectin type 3 domain-containing protein